MRALGYMPVLDFTGPQVTSARAEGHHQGAITKVGRLFCPLTPRRLLDLYSQIRSAKNERERIPLRERLQEIEAYALTRKDTLDDRGTERFACPITKLNCPWAQEREGRGAPPKREPVPVVINLDAHRERTAHPANRPTVEPPTIPLGERPKCCRQSSVTVQGHVMPLHAPGAALADALLGPGLPDVACSHRRRQRAAEVRRLRPARPREASASWSRRPDAPVRHHRHGPQHQGTRAVPGSQQAERDHRPRPRAARRPSALPDDQLDGPVPPSGA